MDASKRVPVLGHDTLAVSPRSFVEVDVRDTLDGLCDGHLQGLYTARTILSSLSDSPWKMASRLCTDPGLPPSSPTRSYWQSPPHALASHQSAQLTSETSVVIIGSGITGTSVAHHLLSACPQLDVVLLEARTITSGATGRNGGHCKDVPFKMYKQWKADFGKAAAERLVRFRGSHLDATRHLAHQLQRDGVVDAQFRDVESVSAVFDPTIYDELKSNMEHWLNDCPDERARCSSMDGSEAEMVSVRARAVLVSRLTACSEVRHTRCKRRADTARSRALAIPPRDRPAGAADEQA